MALSRRPRSSAGSVARAVRRGPTRRGGGAPAPTATPADAGTPVSTSPDVGGGRRLTGCGWLASQGRAIAAGLGGAVPAQSRRRIPRRRAPAAPQPSSACGPDAVTRACRRTGRRAPPVREARGAHRRAASGLCDAHLGVEPAHRLDEARRRPGVQADRVADEDRGLGVRRGLGGGFARDGRCHPAATPSSPARHAPRPPPPRATRHRSPPPRPPPRPRRAAPRSAPPAPEPRQHLDRELGAHQRAAEVHQHEHAVGGHRPLDRRPDPLGVGAEDAGLDVPPAASSASSSPPISRASRDHALGQRVAVGDDDDPDHAQAVRARRRGAGSRSGGPTCGRCRA